MEKNNKLKVIDKLLPNGIQRSLVTIKNEIPLIVANKINEEQEFYIFTRVKYPKCANKIGYFEYKSKCIFPSTFELLSHLKLARNAMKKECAQSLIDFHTNRITNITKLL